MITPYSVYNCSRFMIVVIVLSSLFGCYRSQPIEPFVTNLTDINTPYNEYNSYAPSSISESFRIVYATDFSSEGEETDIWSARVSLEQEGREVMTRAIRRAPSNDQINSGANERSPIILNLEEFYRNQPIEQQRIDSPLRIPQQARSDDQYFLFAREDLVAGTGFDILFARLHPQKRTWLEPVQFADNSEANDLYPTFDLERIYFSSDRNGDYDIFSKPHYGDFESALAIPGELEGVEVLNTPDNECCPYVFVPRYGGVKIMVFASDRNGSDGTFDIFYALWNQDAEEWESPKAMGDLVNTEYNEHRPTLYSAFTMDPKKYILIFSSDRPSGRGGYDLYLAGSEAVSFD